MLNKILMFAYIFFLIGCKTDSGFKGELEIDRYIESYYENGRLKQKGAYLKKRKVGIHKWFYKNGEMKVIAQYSNDTLNGIYQAYHKNGKLKIQTHYQKGKVVGDYLIYNKEGFLLKKRYYYIYNHLEFLNTWVAYNIKGEILVNKSHFFEILNKQDKNIYTLNQPFDLNFLIHPFNNDKISYTVGEFDDSFNLNKNSYSQSFYPDSFSFKVRLKTSKIGENILRFIVDDYTVDSLAKTKTVKPILIEYKYNVIN